MKNEQRLVEYYALWSKLMEVKEKGLLDIEFLNVMNEKFAELFNCIPVMLDSYDYYKKSTKGNDNKNRHDKGFSYTTK